MLAGLLNDCQGGEYHPSAGYIEYVPEEGGSYDMDANADEPTEPSGSYDEDDEWWEDSGESWSDGSAAGSIKPNCADSFDNDGNGMADGDDTGNCGEDEGGIGEFHASCVNGNDDDGDKLTDYLKGDSDCFGEGIGEITNCENGEDDDGDGQRDKNDPDCTSGGMGERSDVMPAE